MTRLLMAAHLAPGDVIVSGFDLVASPDAYLDAERLGGIDMAAPMTVTAATRWLSRMHVDTDNGGRWSVEATKLVTILDGGDEQ